MQETTLPQPIRVPVPYADEDLPLYDDTSNLDRDVLMFAVNIENKLAVLAARLNKDEKHWTPSMGVNLCLRACLIESHMLAKPFCRMMQNQPIKRSKNEDAIPMRFRKVRRRCIEWLRMPMPTTLLLTEAPTQEYLDDDFLRHDTDILMFLQSLNDLAELCNMSVGPNFKKAMLRTAADRFNMEMEATVALRSDPMLTEEVADA